MLQINGHFSLSENLQNDIQWKNQLWGAILLDTFVENTTLVVQNSDETKLPNVLRLDNSLGFDVVSCQSRGDLTVDKIYQNLLQINYDYEKVLEIKSKCFDHIFNILDAEFEVENGKVVAFSNAFCARIMAAEVECFRTLIKEELTALNDGLFCDCPQMALVIINANQENGVLSASNISEICKELQPQFTKSFSTVYYITDAAIYACYPDDAVVVWELSKSDLAECRAIFERILKG